MFKLQLKERGNPLPVTPADWDRLGLQNTIGLLAGKGIIGLERTEGAFLLYPSKYVGEMQAPGVSLSIGPKDPLLHEAILGIASAASGRASTNYEGAAQPARGAGLAYAFLHSLRECLREGLPWTYDREISAGSRVRGKPLFGRSMAEHWSRGRMHEMVVVRTKRHSSEDFANVLWAAYSFLKYADDASVGLRQQAALAMEAVVAPSNSDASLARNTAVSLLGGQLPSANIRALLEACVALLEGRSDFGAIVIPVPSGVARFVDLEVTWEVAVSRLVSHLSDWGDLNVKLHGLAAKEVRLYGSSGPVIDPDVLAFDGETVRFVADAKYKIMPRSDSHGIASDIYQITCYAEALQSPGMLVYLGANDGARIVGSTLSGHSITVATLSAETLKREGEGALHYAISASS